MGYYIQTVGNKSKAEQIVLAHGGKIISKPDFDLLPSDKALIVVVDNGLFETAGLAYNKREFEAFTSPSDHHPKKFVLMDKTKAHQLAGYCEG